MKCTDKEWDHCRVEKMGCTGCYYDEYKLCYVDGNKAWFTNNFERQWGDDWNDRPYEHNAGIPYDSWGELIEDNEDIFKRKWKHHDIKHKVLYFEVDDWNDQRPCDMGRYSVEDINKKAVAWIHTDKFNILAGTTIEEFIDIIEKHGGTIYLPKEEKKMENKYNQEYMQKPISLLTDENLHDLELHCQKQVQREIGAREEEHRIVLELLDKYRKQQEEIEKQNKENIDLKDLYIRTAKHQEKIGHVELAEYMLAQIQAIPTFTTWEEYTTWVSKEDLRKILDKYKHKEIDLAPEFYKELKKLVEE